MLDNLVNRGFTQMEFHNVDFIGKGFLIGVKYESLSDFIKLLNYLQNP